MVKRSWIDRGQRILVDENMFSIKGSKAIHEPDSDERFQIKLYQSNGDNVFDTIIDIDEYFTEEESTIYHYIIKERNPDYMKEYPVGISFEMTIDIVKNM